MLKRALKIGGGLILAILLLLIIVPFLVPTETIKRQIEQAVLENSGWTVRLRGDVGLQFIPSLGISAEIVDAAPPNHQPIFATRRAFVSVSLLALLTGKVSISELSLHRPELNLRLDESGQPVWLETQTAQTAESSSGEEELDLEALSRSFAINYISITDGRFALFQPEANTNVFEGFNLEARLDGLVGPARVTVSGDLNGNPANIEVSLGSVEALLKKTSTPVSVTADHLSAELSFSGNVTGGENQGVEGELSARVERLSDFAPGTLRSIPVSLAGTVVANQENVRVAVPEGNLHDATIQADASIALAGEKPVFDATIAIGAVDLDAIVGSEPGSNGNSPAPTAPGTTNDNQASADDNPLDVLKTIDGNLAFTVQRFAAGGHTISDLKGALVVRDGVAEIGINEVQTAGGQAAAAITANANDAIPSIFGTIRADGLSVPILLALAGQPNTAPRADGLIGANLVFGFRGTAADEVAATINARGTLSLAQGRLDNLGLSGVVGDEAADRVNDLALTVSIDGLENPLSLQGQAGWRGETVRIEAQSEANKLIAGETATTTVRLSSSKIALGYEGPMSTAGPRGGRFFANGRSLRQAASWFGQTLPDGPGYGPFDVSSRIKLSTNRIDLESLNLSIDDIKGTGVVAMTTDAVPRVEAALTFERLNLDPYLGATGESGSGGNSAADAGWSDEPIDFSFTRTVDLTLDAQVQSLVISGITTGPLALKTSVRNGVMQSDLTEMALYGGSGTASVTVNATSAVPVIQTRINLANVDAYPFLRDGAAFERIEGRLAFDTDLTTTGQSQRAMISALNGDMRFAFSDGALRGINIARMMRQLTSNILSGWSPSDNEKTDFSELSASFQITNGIADNQDLILLGPLVRVTGGGTVNLPPQTLSYRVEPKLVASLQGQGGNRDLAGFGVPIIVDGPWANPRIYPDIQGILQNPEAGLRQLRALGGGISRLGEGGAADIVGSLTNGNPAGAALDALSGIAGGNNSNDGATPLPTNRRDLTNAAIGAVGGLLSGNRNQTPETPAPATAALPVNSTGLPVPRAKPGQTSITAEPSNTRPANPLERILENTDTTDPRELLNQGLGGLLNRAN